METIFLFSVETAIDSVLPIVILVFALSMISERFSNFTKLWLPALFRSISAIEGTKRAKGSNKVGIALMQLDNKQVDKNLEAVRLRWILAISVFWGIIIAVAFRKEIWNILNGSPLSGMFLSSGATKMKTWECLNSFTQCWIVIGFGVLFSFGSKFWHDLLDLLLFTKNVRRRVDDIDPSAFSSADEIRQYLLTTNSVLLENALEENRALLKSQANHIKFIKTGHKVINGITRHYISIYLEGPDPGTFPKFVFAAGSKTPIEVNVIPDLGQIKPHVSLGDAMDVLGNGVDSQGTVCCKVVRSNMPDGINYYILTCSHVITQKEVRSLNSGEQVEIGIDGTTNDFTVVQGYLKNNFDYCLVSPPEDYDDDQATNNRILDGIRSVNASDEDRLTLKAFLPSFSNGSLDNSTLKTATLRKVRPDQPLIVKYKNEELKFDKLYAISEPEAELPVTKEGDSGALFYDENGKAVGMVIGSDNKFTYLMSIVDITNNLDCDIIMT